MDDAWKKTTELSEKARDFFDPKVEEDFLKSERPNDVPLKAKPPQDELFLDDDDGTPHIPKADTWGQGGKASEVTEKLKGAAETLGKKAQDISEKVGKEVLEKGEKAWEKFQDVSEKVGKQIMDTSEEVGGKILDKFNELSAKAETEAAKEKEVSDVLAQKAREAKAELERRVQERAAKSNVENLEEDSKKDPLGGFDSFFSRAERFAEGDYQEEISPGMKISQDPDYKPEAKEGTLKGFEDLDGDGDELIDDAILDLDNEGDDKDDK